MEELEKGLQQQRKIDICRRLEDGVMYETVDIRAILRSDYEWRADAW